METPLREKPFRFTKENAVEYGKKGGVRSVQAKIEAEQKRKQELADAIAATEDKTYEGKTLSRVRMQLDLIFEQFIKEKDPQKLDRLASAQARLSEQERLLAGRPTPGALRPNTKRTKSTDPQPISYPDTEPQYMVMHDSPAPATLPPVNDPNEPNG